MSPENVETDMPSAEFEARVCAALVARQQQFGRMPAGATAADLAGGITTGLDSAASAGACAPLDGRQRARLCPTYDRPDAPASPSWTTASGPEAPPDNARRSGGGNAAAVVALAALALAAAILVPLPSLAPATPVASQGSILCAHAARPQHWTAGKHHLSDRFTDRL